MHLSIFVDSEDKKLKQIYVDAANSHNKKIVDLKIASKNP